ncbi:glycosyltransferase family 4 protein [Oleidesulfovibrio sp.]|uniref:glycosyltransferase family 4 protein n=1 Tax=Oleidesulfovibrio sp. TaxID=2909707 RepID=UPI003A86220B
MIVSCGAMFATTSSKGAQKSGVVGTSDYDRPLTVAHCIATNFYGGPERQVLTHLSCLQKAGIRPLLIPFFEEGRRNELYHNAVELNVPAVPLLKQGAFNPALISELAELLCKHGVHVLVTHGYKANVVGRLATWWAGIPEVAVSRGWTAESRKIRCYEWLDKRFLRLAQHVVAVSAGQREKVVACGVPSSNVSVIHNAIDLDSYPEAHGKLRRELGISPQAPFVISAGRLSPEKNHAGMVRAAVQVLKHHPDAVFAVFGEGPLRQALEQQIRDAGLEQRFLLPGFRSDMRSIMHECDVFVLPSFTEGLPNVALEAAASRKPVVCTRVGGSPEVVRHGYNGLLTESGDDAALADAVCRLLGDASLRERMGRSAYERMQNEFSFASQTSQYLNLYQRITGIGCGGGGCRFEVAHQSAVAPAEMRVATVPQASPDSEGNNI